MSGEKKYKVKYFAVKYFAVQGKETFESFDATEVLQWAIDNDAEYVSNKRMEIKK